MGDLDDERVRRDVPSVGGPRPTRRERRGARAARPARVDPVERAFGSALTRLALVDTKVLVCVSGGRDSTVLLELFRRVAPARGLGLEVAHVHHGLRGIEADLDAAHVEACAEAAGLPFHVRRVDPQSLRSGPPSRSRPSPEEAARDLRRAALFALAAERGCPVLATAHHAGDQAETLLLRLLRGTGPDGLAGMRERSDDGRVVRPLLTVSSDSIARFARAHALSWREDASNRDPRYTRNRIRHELLPGLARQFNPGLLRALVDLAEAAGEDRDFIAIAVEAAAETRLVWRDPVLQLSLEGWRELPESVARRVVRQGLARAGLGRDVSRPTILRVLGFLRRERRAGRDKKLELPGGFSLRRVEDRFELAPSPHAEPTASVGTSERAGEPKVGGGSEC